MTDKTIRYTIDDRGVSQSNDRIRREFEETQRKVVDSARKNKKFNQDEIDDLKERIRLVKELNQREEEGRRKQMENARMGWSAAQEMRERKEQSRRIVEANIPGLKSDPNWRSEGEIDRAERNRDILDRRKDFLDKRKEYLDTRETNKKQVKELENIVSTLDRNTNKTIRSTEQTIGSAFRGLTSGSVGGTASSLIGLVGGGGVAAMIAGGLIGSAKQYQDNLRQFAVTTQTPISFAQMMAGGARDANLGMSGTEVLNKLALFQPSLGRYMGLSEGKGLIGAQVSRGFSDQQIQQLLSIMRYSGRSALGTTADFEQYSRERDKSLIKLPEYIGLYLRAANDILNRTGRVDAMGVQQSIMSVGGSYNVSGLQLDKTLGGLTQLSTLSNNPVLLSLQQQAFRKLYPNKTPWDMVKMLQNPAENPELMRAILGQVSSFGGGGMFTKMGMANLGLDPFTVDRLMGSQLKISPRPTEVTSSSQKNIEEKYYESSKDFVGSLQKIETVLGTIKDILNVNVSNLSDGIVDIFKSNGQQEQNMTRAVEVGTTRALQKNPR